MYKPHGYTWLYMVILLVIIIIFYDYQVKLLSVWTSTVVKDLCIGVMLLGGQSAKQDSMAPIKKWLFEVIIFSLSITAHEGGYMLLTNIYDFMAIH